MSLPLPDLILFSRYNNWEKYLEDLYRIYMDELVNSGLSYAGLIIKYRYMPPTNGKGFGFWHLISEGKEEDQRLPALDRCERIRWVKWMILESGVNMDIHWHETRRGSSTNIVLWNASIHYVVILSKRVGYYLLLTAFPTTPGRERSLMTDWKHAPIKG